MIAASRIDRDAPRRKVLIRTTASAVAVIPLGYPPWQLACGADRAACVRAAGTDRFMPDSVRAWPRPSGPVAYDRV